MWRYGTDLADFYRDQMTLRQLWVRIQALPNDCPFWVEVEAEREHAEIDQKAHDIDNVMALFPRKG